MLPALIPILGSLAGKIAESVFPSEADKTKRVEIENAIQQALIANRAEIERGARDALLGEIQGKSWLQRNWRPITMLTFVFLIACHWLGFTSLIAPDNHLSDKEIDGIYLLLQVGMGGYILGRSGEKITDMVMKRREG